jgi:hypothetical protein
MGSPMKSQMDVAAPDRRAFVAQSLAAGAALLVPGDATGAGATPRGATHVSPQTPQPDALFEKSIAELPPPCKAVH